MVPRFVYPLSLTATATMIAVALRQYGAHGDYSAVELPIIVAMWAAMAFGLIAAVTITMDWVASSSEATA